MSEFINTISVLGDEATVDSIITRTITEFKDDTLSSVGKGAFHGSKELESVVLPAVVKISDKSFSDCTKLTKVELPNVATVVANQAFAGCSALKRVHLPKFDANHSNDIKEVFQKCTALVAAYFPSLRNVGWYMFEKCTALKKVDLGSATFIHQFAFESTAIDTLILRGMSVCTTQPISQIFKNTPMLNGSGYIYVPRALVDSYKVATNWSDVADQFRAIEDWSIDGTVTGDIVFPTLMYSLNKVTSSNAETDISYGDSYSTTLTAKKNFVIESVSITIDDVDITDEVYNADTGEVNIPVVTGDVAIQAEAVFDGDYDIVLFPYNGSEEGELPKYKLDVTAGTVLTITYYLTKKQGYVYDGRKCGLNYILGSNEVNVETTITVTIPSDGFIVFSDNNTSSVANGNISNSSGDRLYGKYFYVTIEEVEQ